MGSRIGMGMLMEGERSSLVPSKTPKRRGWKCSAWLRKSGNEEKAQPYVRESCQRDARGPCVHLLQPQYSGIFHDSAFPLFSIPA